MFRQSLIVWLAKNTLCLASPCPSASTGRGELCSKALHPGLGTQASHHWSSHTDTSLARDFRALPSALSSVLGQELSRRVRLILAKTVSGLWSGEGRSAVPGSASRGLCGTGRDSEGPPVPHALLRLCCHPDLPPAFPPSPFTLLFSPPPTPGCCEAPHSFPYSHFHFPALGFAFTLSSTSSAQMTSHKAIRDAPIRLHSWCYREALRDRGVCASRYLFWAYDTGQVTLDLHSGGFLWGLTPMCPFKLWFESAALTGATWMIISHGQGCLTPAYLQESLQASQHSALLLWIPVLPDAEQVRELSQTGLG